MKISVNIEQEGEEKWKKDKYLKQLLVDYHVIIVILAICWRMT